MFHAAPIQIASPHPFAPELPCAPRGLSCRNLHIGGSGAGLAQRSLLPAWFVLERGAILDLPSLLKATPEPVSPHLRQLLEHARAGDAAAFEELIRPHLDSIRRLCFAFSRSWADADDLAQEALLKAFRSISSFQERSELGTWLYSVTRNVCRDFHRGDAARQRTGTDEFDDEASPVSSSRAPPPADELLESKNDAERLWEVLKELAPEFRVPLVLFEVEGLGYEEIAKIERVPLGTIRSRLARARQQLKHRLVELPAESVVSLPDERSIEPSDTRSLR
jgi:RNA polymerase sigma-70 factor (ECF subfamily)